MFLVLPEPHDLGAPAADEALGARLEVLGGSFQAHASVAPAALERSQAEEDVPLFLVLDGIDLLVRRVLLLERVPTDGTPQAGGVQDAVFAEAVSALRQRHAFLAEI
jgi:hypothetical protein